MAVDESGVVVANERTGQREIRAPLGGIAGAILAAGGLVPYLRREGRFVQPIERSIRPSPDAGESI